MLKLFLSLDFFLFKYIFLCSYVDCQGIFSNYIFFCENLIYDIVGIGNKEIQKLM